MSIDNPPIYSGITFNSQFFDDNTGGLSEAQANALYLRKTFPDTATALETFNSGVATASVSSTSSSTNMTIGSNLAATQTLTLGSAGTTTINNGTLQSQSLAPVAPASNLIIGATSTAGINIGNAGVSTTNLYGTVQAGTIDAFTTTGTLNLGQNLVGGTLNVATGSNNDVNVGIGNRTIAVVHNYSDGNNAVAGSNVHLNNGTSNLSNTNIHNGASSAGIVNIGNGASSTTAVSIATRGTTSTNAVRIGNVSNFTYLDSDTIAMGVLGLTGSGAISIATGTNTAGAQVTIGSTSLTAVNIKGGQTNIETTTLNLNTNGTGNTLIGWENGATYTTNTIKGRSLLGGGSDNFPSALINVSTLSTSIRDGIAIKAAGQNSLWYCVWLNQSGTVIGKIEGDGTTVVYSSVSDRRLKKDVVPMENILDKIMLLKPCDYNWISNNKSSFGFIAQEVFEVFPKMYIEARNSDGNIDEPCDKDTGVPCHYGIDYGKFTPYIVKAIQEIKIDYETKLSKLEERILALENRHL